MSGRSLAILTFLTAGFDILLTATLTNNYNFSFFFFIFILFFLGLFLRPPRSRFTFIRFFSINYTFYIFFMFFIQSYLLSIDVVFYGLVITDGTLDFRDRGETGAGHERWWFAFLLN